MSSSEGLERSVERMVAGFAEASAAREKGLAAARATIRNSANCIRAAHRGDFDLAHSLLKAAGDAHAEAQEAMAAFPAILHAGFHHDAAKEFAEASVTLAILEGREIPSEVELGVDAPAYLNGIAEVVGELRRSVLDRLRAGRVDECEPLLQWMDDIYSVLVTVDFPDAMTGQLRRSTDQARGILEKTRGDLALAIVVNRATGQFPAADEAD